MVCGNIGIALLTP
ncbi:hypothetical protein M2H33_21940 [Vibrio vulnificus]|nr:hypothetical protein [Vibrio vulnificus]